MNDSLFETMQIKLEDARDQAPIMVGLAPYLELSSWIDQQLVKLQGDYPSFETHKSHRMGQWSAVTPKT